MGAGRWVEQGWRGLLAAVLLTGAPALAEPAPAPEKPPRPATGVEAGPASADDEDEDEETARGAEPGEKKKKKKKKKKATPRVRATGRVFARVSADEREQYVRTLSVPSARVGLVASHSHLKAEVTADVSSRTLLRDAFVRLATGDKQLRLYGGQFKAPFLARELESAWELPLLRRGVVHKYLTQTQQLGDRRLGLMGEVRVKEAWDLEVSAGVFQGAKDKTLGTLAGEDTALRVSVRPLAGLTLGASTYLAQSFEGLPRHATAAEAGLRLGGLALSGEFVAGRLATGPFTAQLGLASYTLPVGTSRWALQPVVGAEVLQLRGALLARGYGFTGGLNVLFSDHFKAQFQVEHALRSGDEASGSEYFLQLATRF